MDQGSRNAMTTEELFKQHSVFVAKFLRRLGVKDDAIDDAVQEVFLVVHRNGGYAPGTAKPTTYLATISLHAAASQRRRERLATVRAASGDVDELASSKVDSAHDVETHQRLRTLQEALSHLDVTLQQTLILADVEGETCVSIAAAMDVPLGTVYWRLSTARKKFRRALRSVQAAELYRNPHAARAEAPPRARVWSLVAVFGIDSFRSAPDMALLCSADAEQSSTFDLEKGLARLRAVVRAEAPTASEMPVPRTPAFFGSSLGGSIALGAGLLSMALLSMAVLPKRSRSEVDRDAVRVGHENTGSESWASVAVRSTPTAPHTAVPPAPRQTTTSGSLQTDERVAITGTLVPQRGPRASLRRRRATTALTAAVDSAPETRSREEANGSAGSGPGMAALAPEASRTGDSDPKSAQAGASPAQAPVAAAATAQPTRAAPPSEAERGLAEARAVRLAERSLATNPVGSLAIVESLRGLDGPSYLREERDYIEVLALHLTGQSALSRQRAGLFLRNYPGSTFAKDVRLALQRSEPAHD